MLDKDKKIRDQSLNYNIVKCKVKGRFNIINYISENVTLVKLMEKSGNVNHAVSIFGYLIFYYNY